MTKPTTPHFSQGKEVKAVVGQRPNFNSLPAQLTSFVGREGEIEEISALLQNTRLLTLAGPGGSGKTRLATEVARHMADQFEQGIRFVDLAPLEDPELIAESIARVLGLEEQATEPLWKTLEHFLKKRHILLLLDNFEHLLEGASRLAELLSKAPRLTILVTSRESLRLYGEHEYLVEPLPVPVDFGASIDALLQFPAIQLFVDRARQIRPSFQLNERTAVPVVAICQLLDGLPLAIELAAARLRLFGPEALLARLQGKKGESSLSVLVSHNRDAPNRQQTLRATIAWSYELLQPSDQLLFNQFAIFAGGAGPEAVKEICLQNDQTIPETIELLSNLVDKNLLFVMEGVSKEPRFQMLQVVREYARERLDEQGGHRLIGARHARYYLNLVEQIANELKLTETSVRKFEAEQNNLRAALNWTLDNQRATQGLRALPSLSVFWTNSGHASEGRLWTEKILAADEEFDMADEAAGLTVLSKLIHHENQPLEALKYFDKAVTLYRILEDPHGIAKCLIIQGSILRWLDRREEAKVFLEESLVISREEGGKFLISSALLELQNIALYHREYHHVHSIANELHALVRETNNFFVQGANIFHQGVASSEQGNYELGRQQLENSLGIARSLRNSWFEASIMAQLGFVVLRAGYLAEAKTIFEETLRIDFEIDLWPHVVAYCLDGLARLAVFEGHNGHAVSLWAGAEFLRGQAGVSSLVAEEQQRSIKASREKMAAEEFEQAWELGTRLAKENKEELIAIALSPLPESELTAVSTNQSGRPLGLTPRQVEVLRLVARGMTDAEVAEALVISSRTVNNHLTTIYQKLDVKSRTAAALIAREHGLT